MSFIRRNLENWLFPLRMALGCKIMSDERRKIVQVSRTELIKGPCSSQELEAMLYVGEHAGAIVSAPAVHRTYQRGDGVYIAMDFVAGERLDHVWLSLSEGEQREVVGQIWGWLCTLRALPGIGMAVSSVDGGGVRDGAICQDIVGPFAHLKGFELMMATSAPGLDDFKHFWTPPGQAFESCLTHADISPRNIIRCRDGSLSILDWEFAGWWPPYWVYVKWHFSDFPPLPGWTDMLDDVSKEGGNVMS